MKNAAMKTRWLVTAALGAAGLPLALAPLVHATSAAPGQDAVLPAQTDSGGGLRRVGAGEAPDGQRGFAAERWAERLRDRDLVAREEAYDALARLVRRDPVARAQVEAWARSSEDPELAWTARLLRREAARGGGLAFLDPLSTRALPFGAGDARELLRGLDPRLFTGDPFEGLDEMLERMGVDPSRVRVRGFGPGLPGGAASVAESFRLEVGPDGVRCEIEEEDESGDTSTRTYEAESLEALLEAHPELRDRIGAGGVFGLAPRPQGLAPWDPFGRGLERTPWLGTRQVPTDVLGIEFRKDDPRLDEVPGVEPGVGLYVERTVPGTIAHIMGLKRGWVLVELNGRQLVDGDDVSAALSAREPHEPIHVTFVDGEGQRRTLTWKPAEPFGGDGPSVPDAPAEPRDGSRPGSEHQPGETETKSPDTKPRDTKPGDTKPGGR